VDFVLIMSVNPGFGGQKFIPHSLNKIRQLVRRRTELGLQYHIEIDGGVTLENVQSVVEAGAEWMVAGSAVFHTVNPADTFLKMTRLANAAQFRQTE
jgi:ribulose-phosphate 3-epimerase